MKFQRLFILWAILLLVSAPALAQTALTSTTLAEAVDGEETTIDLASVSGISADDIAFVDQEAMLVVSVDSDNTNISVIRGWAGTVADDHANSRLIWVDEPGRFIQTDLVGTCTAGSEYPNYSPLINVRNGKMWRCTNSVWTEVLPDSLYLGDSQARDVSLFWDGNAQDFHIGLDDSADDLLIGVGTALGTTPAIGIDENQVVTLYADPVFGGTTPTLTLGDAGAEDVALVYDGNAQDFYLALDDSLDHLVVGLGSAVGTTPIMSFDSGNLNQLIFEGTTDDGNETTLSFDDAASDVTVTIPDVTFTVGDFAVTQAYGPTVADHVDSIFFIADRGYTVTDIDVVWGTAESTGSMDVMVERLQATEACGSGDDLLSAAVDGTGAADTVNNGSLTATTSNLNLAAGDRLCADLTATPNEITELTITVGVTPN